MDLREAFRSWDKKNLGAPDATRFGEDLVFFWKSLTEICGKEYSENMTFVSLLRQTFLLDPCFLF